MQKAQKWIDESNIFTSGKKIGVGVSGGPDSMALLVLLEKLSKEKEFEIVAINIDHSLRKASAGDSKFVENFCKEKKIKFLHKKIDVEKLKEENGWTTEQAARIARYQAFDTICDNEKLDYLCLAHHKDDQAETVLMHIFRGSGLKGATGMEFVTSTHIVRPFLNITKTEIMEYVKKNEIPFVIDETNDDEKFTRNFIRTKIIPVVKKVYPSVVDSLCLFAENCRADESFISEQISKEHYIENNNEIKIFDSAQKISKPLFVRLLKKCFEKIGVNADIESKHISIVKDVFLLKAGSRVDLPHNSAAFRDYDGVTICKKTEKEHSPTQLFSIGETIIQNFKIKVEFTKTPVFGEKDLYLDYEKIPSNAEWRTKQTGDIFTKLGSTGSKKLSDYFTDKKIPQRKREELPLLCFENNVLLVAGEDISDFVKIDDQTEKIIKISFTNFQKEKTKEKTNEHKSSKGS